MKVELFDRIVDVKELKLGTVVFLVHNEDDPETWFPAHVTGFPNNSAMKNVGIMVNGVFVYYVNIAWNNEE